MAKQSYVAPEIPQRYKKDVRRSFQMFKGALKTMRVVQCIYTKARQRTKIY